MALRQAAALRLFDAHCHLQDERLSGCLRTVIEEARQKGVEWFAVNGTCEDDWGTVKQISEEYPETIPNFGLHPWFVAGRSEGWLSRLRKLLEDNPEAAVGEAGLDKMRTDEADMDTQVEVLRQQLALAREVKRPISVHCVRAFGQLHGLLKEMGYFPEGVIVHSYSGSAEMVAPLAACGAYFSFSGFLFSTKRDKAARILAQVPFDRLLLETDAPDALPCVDPSALMPLPADQPRPLANETSSSSPESPPQGPPPSGPSSENINARGQDLGAGSGGPKLPDRAGKPPNHPGNITLVASLVAELLGKKEEEVTHAAFANASRLFRYPGSKLNAKA